MTRHVTIKPYLSLEELETRYRKAKDAVERSHWQMIWLLAQSKSTREVAEVTGYCRNWIHILARRYNQQRPQVLVDHRHANPGPAPSCPPNNKPTWSRTSRLPLLTVDCGPGGRWPAGLRPKQVSRCIPNAAGSISGGSASASACCVPATPKRIRLPKPSLKTSPSAWRNCSAASLKRASSCGPLINTASVSNRSYVGSGCAKVRDRRSASSTASNGSTSTALCIQPRAKPSGSCCQPWMRKSSRWPWRTLLKL